MSRIKVENGEEFDIEFEQGDAIVVIQEDGGIRKIYMPDMDTKYFNSEGYAKLLECIDIIKPGTKEEFVKYHEKERKGRIH
mgnify:CR=1 FL=1